MKQAREAKDAPPGFTLAAVLRSPGRVLRVAWSPDGRRIAVSTTSGVAIFAYPVDEAAGPERSIDSGGGATAIAWSPDGNRLAVAGNGLLRVWNLEKGDWEGADTTLEAAPQCLMWFPDGRQIAVGHGDGNVRIHRIGETTRPRTMRGRRGDGILALAWSPDGSVFASGSKSGNVHRWEAETGKRFHGYIAHTEAVTGLTWLDGGRRLASASRDATAAVWDVDEPENEIRLRGHQASLTSLSASFDGRFLATKSSDGTVRLWRTTTGEQLAKLPEPTLGSSLPNVAFHPSEHALATIGEGDEVVRIWSLNPAAIEVASPPGRSEDETGPMDADRETSAEVGPTEASILVANVHDVATAEDSLGFKPYVEAVAEFLTHSETKPPLTLSVEGSWGSGKSSFMLQLKEVLEGDGHPCIEFNPWRLSRRDEVWAAFALHFVREAMARRERPRGPVARARAFLERYDWQQGRAHLAKTGASVLALAGGAVAALALAWVEGVPLLAAFASEGGLLRALGATAAGGTGLAAYAAAVSVGAARVKRAWARVEELTHDPLEAELEAYLNEPRYRSRTAFIEHFHEDFERNLDLVAGPKSGPDTKRVYVFIDDLDRCDVPKAADLMQAINLMIPNDPRLVFVIGMDREKVAAGLAVKYERVLPYLAAAEPYAGASKDPRDPAVGLEFGYNFLEKFIQVPFLVPRPTEAELHGFLATLSPSVRQGSPAETAPVAGKPEGQVKAKPAREAAPTPGGSDGERPSGPASAVTPDLDVISEQPAPEPGATPDVPGPGGAPKPVVTPEQRVRRARTKWALTGDSENVRRLALMVAPALDDNPRRVKQFLNLFRLRAFIAINTGLFDAPEDPSLGEGLTLEQFGKFVALSIRWPLLLADLARRPDLLAILQRLALGEDLREGADLENVLAQKWARRPRLVMLLRHGIEGAPDQTTARRFSLAEVDVRRLLQVSPVVSRPIEEEETRQVEVKAGGLPSSREERAVAAFDRGSGVWIYHRPGREQEARLLAAGLGERGLHPRVGPETSFRSVADNAPGVVCLVVGDDLEDSEWANSAKLIVGTMRFTGKKPAVVAALPGTRDVAERLKLADLLPKVVVFQDPEDWEALNEVAAAFGGYDIRPQAQDFAL